MKKFLKILAVVFLVIAAVCLILAACTYIWGVSAMTSFWTGLGLSAGVAGALSLSTGCWLLLALIAVILGYCCSPQTVRDAAHGLVNGTVRILNDALDTVTKGITSSSWFWWVVGGFGVYLLVTSGGDTGTETVHVKEGDNS